MDSALWIVDSLLVVVGAIVRAAARGDTESVAKIIGEDLAITIARARAEAEALEKFHQ